MKPELYDRSQVGDTWRVAFLGVRHLAVTNEGAPILNDDGTQADGGTTTPAATFQDSSLTSDTFSCRYWDFLSGVCELTPLERKQKWDRIMTLMRGGEIE